MDIQPPFRYPAPWEANILAGGTLLMLLISSGILSVFFPLPVVLIVGQLLIIVPALASIVIRHFPLRATFGLYPVSASAIVWSVLIGFACWPVVAGMVTLLEKPLLQIGPYPPAPFPINWVERGAFGLAYIVLAPLTEESIYRGFILQAWLRRGIWVGIVMSGFLFGLLHSQIAPLIPISFFGMVLGFLVHRSQSVLSSIFAHASYKTAATLFVVVPYLQATPGDVFIGLGIIAFPIALLLIWLFLRRNPISPNTLLLRDTAPRWNAIVTLLTVLNGSQGGINMVGADSFRLDAFAHTNEPIDRIRS